MTPETGWLQPLGGGICGGGESRGVDGGKKRIEGDRKARWKREERREGKEENRRGADR
jgi:hypothetical protein